MSDAPNMYLTLFVLLFASFPPFVVFDSGSGKTSKLVSWIFPGPSSMSTFRKGTRDSLT